MESCTALRISFSLIRFRAACSVGERGSGRGGGPLVPGSEKKRSKNLKDSCPPPLIPPLPIKNKGLQRRLIRYGQDQLRTLITLIIQLLSNSNSCTNKKTHHNKTVLKEPFPGMEPPSSQCMLLSLRSSFLMIGKGPYPGVYVQARSLAARLLIPPLLLIIAVSSVVDFQS